MIHELLSTPFANFYQVPLNSRIKPKNIVLEYNGKIFSSVSNPISYQSNLIISRAFRRT